MIKNDNCKDLGGDDTINTQNDSCNNPDCSMFAGALFLNEPMTHGLLFGAVLILVGIRQVTK